MLLEELEFLAFGHGEQADGIVRSAGGQACAIRIEGQGHDGINRRAEHLGDGPLRDPCCRITSLIETVFVPPLTGVPSAGLAAADDEN